MNEGEILKGELKKKYFTLKRAIEEIGMSKPTLYKYLEMERVPTTVLEQIEMKTGINIRLAETPINESQTIEKKIERMEKQIYELQTQLIKLLNR